MTVQAVKGRRVGITSYRFGCTSTTHNIYAKNNGYLWQMGKRVRFGLCMNDSPTSVIGVGGLLIVTRSVPCGYKAMGL